MDSSNASSHSELIGYVYYTFTPFLIVILLLTVISNASNIFMIAKLSIKQCTSLNIALFNISIFNFLLAFNQTVLLVHILRRGAQIPTQVCHVVLIINTVSSLGISLTHLFIAWDRYKIAVVPLSWINNRRVAWMCTTALWIGVVILGTHNLLFQIEGITGDINNCFIASSSCPHAFSISLQLIYLLVLATVSALTYTCHAKTISAIKKNKKANAIQLQRSSNISVERPRGKTGPEKAIDSLTKVQTLHLITQAPIYLYKVMKCAFVILSPLPIIILTTASFITALSPIFMLLFNSRYKQNITLFWICNKKDKQQKFEDPTDGNEQNAQPKPHPNDKSIFFSVTTDRAKYSVPKKGKNSHKQQSQRGSTSNPTVTTAALKAGLMLSAAGHQIRMNNFFKEDPKTWLYEMYGGDPETVVN